MVRFSRSVFLFAALASVALPQVTLRAQEPPKPASGDINVALKVFSEGAARRIGGYIPLKIGLSTPKPDAVKKVPDDLSPTARYGALRIGTEGKETEVPVLVDAPEGKPARVWIDTNRNGDFTDDATIALAASPYKARGASAGEKGVDLTLYRGTAQIPLAFGGATTPVTVGLYLFDPTDPNRPTAKETLYYFRDWGMEGQATLGDSNHSRALPLVLDDEWARGDYADRTRLWILFDVNSDGRFSPRGERFRADKPFNIGGITYEVKAVDAVAGTLTLAKSDKKVDAIVVPPPVVVGKAAPQFSVAGTDGETIEFPQGFRGKLVLLDFWATWHEPSVADVPNRAALYAAKHSDGLEVIGVSLDPSDNGAKLTALTKKEKVTWPQVFDGNSWDTPLARLYGVEELPQAFLLDGDTGTVLAMGETLRGEQATKTIDAALQTKKTATPTRPEPATVAVKPGAAQTEPGKSRYEVKSVPPAKP